MEEKKAAQPKMKKAELMKVLLNEYNQHEKKAFSKLEEIFYLMKSCKGAKELRFKGGYKISSNAFHHPDQLDYKLILQIYDRAISGFKLVNPGD